MFWLKIPGGRVGGVFLENSGGLFIGFWVGMGSASEEGVLAFSGGNVNGVYDGNVVEVYLMWAGWWWPSLFDSFGVILVWWVACCWSMIYYL